MNVVCDYCGGQAKLVDGTVIYPHRADLAFKRFWKCDPCDAWVGCHPPKEHAKDKSSREGTVPMGRLANMTLRALKQHCHALFDPMWKKGDMTRGEAYDWLAGRMGIKKKDCHIGLFDEAQCLQALKILSP